MKLAAHLDRQKGRGSVIMTTSPINAHCVGLPYPGQHPRGYHPVCIILVTHHHRLNASRRKNMQHRHFGIVELLRRVWWRVRGEQPLVTTFWPQDYPRGKHVMLDGQTYRITRYVHAQEYRFFEVWGRAVCAPRSPCKP